MFLFKDRDEYLWLLNLKVLMYKKKVCKCTGAAENPFLNSVYRGEILDLGFQHNAISSLFKHNEIHHLNKFKKTATFFHLCKISNSDEVQIKCTNFQLVRTSLATATNHATGKNLVLFVTRWSHICKLQVARSNYLNAQIMSGKKNICNLML